MTAPRRVQLSRRRGYRKPADAVVVARPSRWGNPYKLSAYTILDQHGRPATREVAEREAREMALRDFEAALDLGGILPFTRDDVRRELRGKTLACWCSLLEKCHADVLLEIANR